MFMSNKKMGRLGAILLVVCLMMALSTQMVFATNGLNGVGDGSSTTVTENVTTTTNQNTANVGDTTTSQPTTTQPQTQTNNQQVVTNSTTATGTDVMPGLPDSGNDPASVDRTANAVSGLFNNAGPDEEDIAIANQIIAPIADIMNKVMAIILGVTSLLMMFTTTLDLLYLAFPPVRDYLDGGRQGRNQMMMGGRGMGGRGMGGMRGGMGMGRMGGMGMGGMGMGGMGGMNGMGGMGGMGMGGMNGMGGMGMQGGMQQGMGAPVGGGLSAVGRWVSDEAVSACNECMGGAMEGQMGMQGTTVKSMVFCYIKKRSMFLLLFGVCVILFSSTVFFDLGARLGTWILRMIMGFGA